jgi:hypothetical protein
MDAATRTSRRRLVAMLSAVTVVHAGVLLTSEREGPGSAQLRSGPVAGDSAAPVPPSDGTAVAAGPVAPPAAVPTNTVPPASTATAVAPPTAVPPSPTAIVAAPTTVPAVVPANSSAPAATATARAASPTALAQPVAAAAPAAGYAVDPAPTAVAPTPRPAQTAAPASPPRPTEAPKTALLPPTQTMPGGRNNYAPNAPMVPNLGKGFLVAGTVLDTSGEPVANTRVQIWLNTARGGEREPSNRGSVMTDALGKYRLETSPVVPVFGQPHVHIGYDDGKFGTLFLRPVLKSEKDPSITVDFVLGPSGAV